ncbi:hypothetical protein KEJ49_05715 [Candidatus Bathyarchaeota archaeon]|nr:hypothetical protein [Candidatus Bathyarchaeota archaeon]
MRGLIHPHRVIFSTRETASRVLGELKESGRYEAVVRSNGKIRLVTVRPPRNRTTRADKDR